MATSYVIMGILCFAFAGSIGMSNVNLLTENRTRYRYQQREIQYRRGLVKRANAEIGVREETGNNDGERVEEYLAAAGLKKGSAYCAAFVSWLFKQEGFSLPRTGWSPALFPVTRLARSALPANVFGIYFPELHRVAHVGIIERIDGDWCISIEANTGLLGVREGEGVFRKRRHIKMIHCMADWVSPERRGR